MFVLLLCMQIFLLSDDDAGLDKELPAELSPTCAFWYSVQKVQTFV